MSMSNNDSESLPDTNVESPPEKRSLEAYTVLVRVTDITGMSFTMNAKPTIFVTPDTTDDTYMLVNNPTPNNE